MKRINFILYTLVSIAIFLLMAVNSNGSRSVEKNTMNSKQAKEVLELKLNLQYEPGENSSGYFFVNCHSSNITDLVTTPKEFNIRIYGLEEYKDEEKPKLILYLDEPANDHLFLKEIKASIKKYGFSFKINENRPTKYEGVEIKGKRNLEIYVKKGNQGVESVSIEIENYEKVKPFLLEGKIITYVKARGRMEEKISVSEIDKDGKFIVPASTFKIEFEGTLLPENKKEFDIVRKREKIVITMVTKHFAPKDISSKETVRDVEFILYYNKERVLEKKKIGENKGFIEFSYPKGCDELYLKLTKDGYHDKWTEDITKHKNYKPADDRNPILMQKTLMEVILRITNGKGAVVNIGNERIPVEEDGTAKVNVDPGKKINFSVSKECYETFYGTIKSGEFAKSVELKPISVQVKNEGAIKCNIIVTDEENKQETHHVTGEKEIEEIPVYCKKVSELKLEKEIIADTGTKISLIPPQDGKAWIIKPEWQIVNCTFDITMEKCGKKLPDKLEVTIGEAIGNTGSFEIPVNKRTRFSYSASVKIPYNGYRPPSQASFSLANLRLTGELIKPVEINNRNVLFPLQIPCGPALAIVAFLTNSHKGLLKQDIVDAEMRLFSVSNSNFRELYRGWVSYNKTNYRLIDFENSSERQIQISDINTNDTTEQTLRKIIYDIQLKFSNANVANRKKLIPDEIWILLDTDTISVNSKIFKGEGYEKKNFNVRFKNINGDLKKELSINKKED